MKERNPSRVNSQQSTVNSSIFYGFPFQWFPFSIVPHFNSFPTKALEFFTLRSSLFT